MTKTDSGLKHSHLLLALSSLLAFAACGGAQEGGESHHNGEKRSLSTLPGLDHGLIQSPVNILSAKSASGTHSVVVNAGNTRAKDVVNTGHSVQLDFAPGASITFDGKTYDFAQLHFHTPSEHQIDGVTYPMEMHCVNIRPPEGGDGPPEYLVVGIFFKMGAEDPFISGFLERIPDAANTTQSLDSSPVYLTDLLGEMNEAEPYYHYNGSLTTPPYTETVTWLVVKRVFDASQEQIQTINQLEGDNARHVQALYGRKIDQD